MILLCHSNVFPFIPTFETTVLINQRGGRRKEKEKYHRRSNNNTKNCPKNILWFYTMLGGSTTPWSLLYKNLHMFIAYYKLKVTLKNFGRFDNRYYFHRTLVRLASEICIHFSFLFELQTSKFIPLSTCIYGGKCSKDVLVKEKNVKVLIINIYKVLG